jgi:hydrogenase maturation protein HypF
MAFEGQAAMLLEGMAAAYGQVEPLRDGYQINEINAALTTTETMLELDLLPLLAYLLMKHEAGEIEAAFGAALFHATLAFALADWTQRVARLQGVNTIALGGGCFLNHILSRDLNRYLTGQGFTVLSANQVPPNDAGLSLGQAWVVIQKIS